MDEQIKIFVCFFVINNNNKLFLVSRNSEELTYKLPGAYLKKGEKMEAFFINYAKEKYNINLSENAEMIFVDEKIDPHSHEILILFRAQLAEEPKKIPIELIALSLENILKSEARFMPSKEILLSIMNMKTK